MIVKILKDDASVGVFAGETYKARRYDESKCSLLERISDGYIPECNQYKHNLAFLISDVWMVIKDGRYIPEAT